MKLYLDTSLIVSALTNETSTEAALDWIAANQARGFATSRWSITEFSSAIALKVRNGHLNGDQRAVTLRTFDNLLAAFDVVPVQTADFDFAARVANQDHVALRSGDALHLAVAMRVGSPLRTMDRRFVSGALATGHDVQLVSAQ